MTEAQFNKWLDTAEGEAAFCEYLYENYPEMGDDALVDAMQSGDYIDGFMEDLGVEE